MKTIDTGTTDVEVGRQVLNKLGPVVEGKFGVSIQNVLTETPRSNLVIKPHSGEKQEERRKTQRECRDHIQGEYDKHAEEFVMRNRVSWSLFDKMRKTNLEDTPNRKRKGNPPATNTGTPPKQRCHGVKADNLEFDKDRLMQESSQWDELAKINWSELARNYGITKPNGGQIVKEFLAQQGVAAAQINQHPTRTPRRSKRKMFGKVSFPMPSPVSYQKKVLDDKIQRGEILIGDEVAETTYTKFKVDRTNSTKSKEPVPLYARRIELTQIREKLLRQHEEQGLIRDAHDDHFDSISLDEVKAQLHPFNENPDTLDMDE